MEQRLQSLSVVCGAQKPSAAPAAVAAKEDNDDDDDGVDLFGSDSEDENDAAAKVREQRLAEYAAKKSKSLFIFNNIMLCVEFRI